MSFTIGSLFDGSGGFPLAATMCGGTPKWAAEVEPYPIAVTKSRFPDMKHLGSVTDIKGSEVDPVDVISFGSPCQDLSVAGKRAGLKHEANGDDETTRSGLFMEAVRIIKEMREATNGAYPRFALWENVPGAFSSNKGEDFRTVLEELIKIVEPTAVMPEVPKNGWPYADSYCGDGWSLAYRVLDSQFWGVPQRRRRCYLILDLRGECAGKVSFEREGLRGYFETGRTPWQTVAGDAEGGVGTADCEGFDGYNSTLTGDKAATLGVNCGMSTGRNGVVEQVPYTLKIRSGCEGGGKGALIQTDKSATLSTLNDQYLFQPVIDCHILDDQGGSQISVRDDGKCPTLRAEMHGNVPCVMDAKTWDSRGNGDGKVVSTITGGHECSISDYTSLVLEPIPIHDQTTRFSGKHDPQFYTDGTVPTLVAKGPCGVCVRYIVRRLTPTECARLQGFPDKWGHPDEKTEFTDNEYQFWLNVRNTHAAINEKAVKEYTKDQMLKWYNSLHTDSSEYKMWGNGIALPNALYMMQGIADVMTEEKAARRKWLADLLGDSL